MMDTKDEEFLKRLQATFRIEADEHLSELTTGLIELEKAPKNKTSVALIETMFREIHSLKGAARSVNMKGVESLCQELENIFGKLKNEQLCITTGQYDVIYKALDCITKIVSTEGTKIPRDNGELIKQLKLITETSPLPKTTDEEPVTAKNFIKETATDSSTPEELIDTTELLIEEKPAQVETVRIPTAKLDPLFLQAEQLIQSKIASAQRTSELRTINDFIDSWKKEAVNWEAHRSFERGLNTKEIIDWNNEKLNALETNLTLLNHAIENDQRSLERMVDDHLEAMKSILMLPVATIIEGFPKFVRDLARNQGKAAELIVMGNEIEVDKRILEELKDPLIHLIRNCIDHGIKKNGDDEQLTEQSHGKVSLNFNATESRHLEIIVSDDGAGIDLDKVRNAAVKTGFIDRDSAAKLNRQETLMLIFQSGVTTSQMITDISGRGLGLAIVREKVEKLGGSVTVESQSGVGTTFHLLLPLTLATFRGILVKIGEDVYAVPTIHVERAVRLNREEIKTVENRDTIMIDGIILNAVYLSTALGLAAASNGTTDKKSDSPGFIQLIILTHTDKRIAFIVDEILEECQILVKELGRQLNRVRNISGATVLGSGSVVPVINVTDLLKSAAKITTSGRVVGEKKIQEKIYKILVAEDSITSRALIKNILESAGYSVETAVDGMDAFTKVLVGEFDLVVSDVDMPRMNGFELTAKIRKDKKNNELPVVLVTALESREDREHGIDVGANAYIVKSSFDQSNLLEVIQKLL